MLEWAGSLALPRMFTETFHMPNHTACDERIAERVKTIKRSRSSGFPHRLQLLTLQEFDGIVLARGEAYFVEVFLGAE